MDYKHLSKRLHKVGELVPTNAKVADIGSDHAYLPAYLVLNKKITAAIAGEVVDGPFLSAKNLVAELNLTKEIDVRKGDGLAVLSPIDEVTTITICGMGGALLLGSRLRFTVCRGIRGIFRADHRAVRQPAVARRGGARHGAGPGARRAAGN